LSIFLQSYYNFNLENAHVIEIINIALINMQSEESDIIEEIGIETPKAFKIGVEIIKNSKPRVYLLKFSY
jgi:hypothetical protein